MYTVITQNEVRNFETKQLARSYVKVLAGTLPPGSKIGLKHSDGWATEFKIPIVKVATEEDALQVLFKPRILKLFAEPINQQRD